MHRALKAHQHMQVTTNEILALSTDILQSIRRARKPIYDDDYHRNLPTAQDIHETTLSSESIAPQTVSQPTSARESLTDRLAVHVRRSRLFIHHYAAALEKNINRSLTRTLQLESDVTSTVRSLAPSRQSGEKLLPGSIYVLVAAMAGTIVTRNRNLLLRTIVPIGMGAVAGRVLLPVTSANVADLAWKYEQRFPVVRDMHLATRDRMGKFVETGKAHSAMGLARVEEKVDGAKEVLESWVQKGR